MPSWRKNKKVNLPIYHPHDWYQLVRACSSKFTVVEIEPGYFMDFSALLKDPLVSRHKDVAGKPFKWHDVQWLPYIVQECGTVQFKTSLNREEPFPTLNFRRRGTHDINVRPLTDKPVPISVQKK
ncbi:hypothetical protein PR048_015830 [Dryococelus australis]|uniref:Uncharacterized protein n=1 Tax=Dryococelus australis TaxID=614101 RepID=A0ABQ9HIC6_9NEOP|nr:hypothetical protein PR048_015830 [Dryococelus australis]